MNLHSLFIYLNSLLSYTLDIYIYMRCLGMLCMGMCGKWMDSIGVSGDMWQNRPNYSDSSALTIIHKDELTTMHFKRSNPIIFRVNLVATT
jgi:hypothetical protein